MATQGYEQRCGKFSRESCRTFGENLTFQKDEHSLTNQNCGKKMPHEVLAHTGKVETETSESDCYPLSRIDPTRCQ